VIAPLSGEVTAVNEALGDAPEQINEDPYGGGWLIKVKLTSPEEAETLLSADEYRKLLENL
jgi:glycine cleavage system H protein